MRALVTGGAGFIGSNLVASLVDDGHEVTVLDNLSSGYRENLGAGPSVHLQVGDVTDATAVDQAMAGVNVVFHLAASVGNQKSIERPVADSQVNLIGTLEVLEAARRNGIRTIVYSSSAAIFGDVTTLPIKEDHALEPASPYGVSKLAAEKMCLAYARLHQLNVVCLRYFNVYGVNQRYDVYGNVIPIFVRQALRGEPLTVFGDGEQTRDFVSVDDVVAANRRAAGAIGLSGAFNIASGTPVSVNRLAALVCQAAGVERRIAHRPPRAGDVRHSVADISAARAAFSYEPRTRLEDGVTAYVRWARETAQAVVRP
jgi:UDP-glucose 4-epimerase